MSEPAPEVEEHRRLQGAAVAADGRAYRALLAGEADAARAALGEAAALYRSSWEAAPPGAFGRLVGLVKAGVLGGDGVAEARYVRAALGTELPSSPAAAYALALSALALRDDGVAADAAGVMAGGSEPFGRAATAITALAGGDGGAYATAVAAIARDFESRAEHLTGVPIADTALVLETLAARRGLAAHLASPLLPR